MVLTISDHLAWSDANTHLQAIEVKVNAYLAFVQSGQLSEDNSDANDRQVKIAIYQKEPEPPEVKPILDKLVQHLEFIGVELWRGSLPSKY